MKFLNRDSFMQFAVLHRKTKQNKKPLFFSFFSQDLQKYNLGLLMFRVFCFRDTIKWLVTAEFFGKTVI